MEDQFVHSVYEQIAGHFDSTRCNLWKGVVDFLEQVRPQSKILDVGCGNGKYLSVRRDCEVHACDACPQLANIAKQKHPHAHISVANAISMPYNNNVYDNLICIAVLHHLSTVEKRANVIKEIIRVLKPGGTAFITVWATEARKPSWKEIDGGENDYMVPWHHKQDNTILQRFYHLFTHQEITSLITGIPCASIEDVKYEMDNWQITIKKC
jgi:ubiquinone/menaquinone biosynthesis C-methylase UbiE